MLRLLLLSSWHLMHKTCIGSFFLKMQKNYLCISKSPVSHRNSTPQLHHKGRTFLQYWRPLSMSYPEKKCPSPAGTSWFSVVGWCEEKASASEMGIKVAPERGAPEKNFDPVIRTRKPLFSHSRIWLSSVLAWQASITATSFSPYFCFALWGWAFNVIWTPSYLSKKSKFGSKIPVLVKCTKCNTTTCPSTSIFCCSTWVTRDSIFS